MIKVYEPGTKVCFGEHMNHVGLIQQVSISPSRHVMYQVVYFKDQERQSFWAEDFEIEPTADTRRIGVYMNEAAKDAQGQGNKLPADGPASDSNQSGVQEASSLVEGIPDSPTDY